MGKWTGAIMQMIAAGFLIAAGAAFGTDPLLLLILGLGFGIGGLWAWDRGARKQLLPPPSAKQDPDAALHVARLEDVLASMQADVQKLTEDREFYQRLYGAERAGEPEGR